MVTLGSLNVAYQFRADFLTKHMDQQQNPSGDLPHPSRCEEPRVIARRTPSAAMDKISHGPVGPRNLVWGAMIVQQKNCPALWKPSPNSSLGQAPPKRWSAARIRWKPSEVRL